MANSLNKTIIIGRLGNDPELHQGTKTDYAHFSIADSTPTKDGGENIQWHRICAFGKQAHLCHDYLHKGDLCCIEGRLESRSYEKEGQKLSSYSIIAERITFMSSKRRSTPIPEAPNTPESCSINDL